MSAAAYAPEAVLSPDDERQLYVESGIDPQVADRRGYRRIDADEAAALGFAPSQCRAGLYMPTFTLAGVEVVGMLKPDEPRIDAKGKIQEYEHAARQPPRLDV